MTARVSLYAFVLPLFAASLCQTKASEPTAPKAETVEPRKEPRGRRVILRYTERDPQRIFEMESVEGPYDFAVRLTSDLRRFGVSRVIMPDPTGTDREEFWQAASRHASIMGFEILFEIDVADLKVKETKPESEKSLSLLSLDNGADQESAYLKRVSELSELRTSNDEPIVKGLFLALTPPVSLPADWESGLDQSTFQEFLNETGLAEDWADRLKSDEDRREFVRSRGLMPWLTWRSRRVARFYGGLSSKIQERHGLGVMIAAPQPENADARSQYAEAERIGVSPLFAWRWMAFDPELWREYGSVRLIGSESVTAGQPDRDWATHPDLRAALSPFSSHGQWFSGSIPIDFREKLDTWRIDSDFDSLMSSMVSHLSQLDSQCMIVDRCVLADRHTQFASWVNRFEGLPEIGRKAWEAPTKRPGMTLRAYAAGESEFLVPINPLPCPMSLELQLVRKKEGTGGPVDPDSDLNLRVDDLAGSRTVARLVVAPFHFGRIDLGPYRVESYQVELPQESQDVVRTRYDALLQQQSTAPVAPRGEAAPIMVEKESNNRGRRLMAALQAYREMRLADFFRLSDGVITERRSRRFSENTADARRDDLPKRRLIR